MGGSPTYVERDGQLLTPWMLYVIMLLDADLFRLFGVHVIVTSAIRTYARQEQIFRERYVTAGNIRGRRVYDNRVWRGVRWYRISPAGTVAVPGTSNHEIQGTKAAVDIRDTGSDAGITSRNSVRGRWIREWCRRFGLLIASGDGFGEGWHFDVPNIFNIPPSTGGPATGGATAPAPIEIPEGYDMNDVKQIHCTADDKPTGPVHQRALLVPGTAWVLPFTESGATFANTAADQFETGNSRWYTKSMFNAFIAASARCAPTSINVEIANAES